MNHLNKKTEEEGGRIDYIGIMNKQHTTNNRRLDKYKNNNNNNQEKKKKVQIIFYKFSLEN